MYLFFSITIMSESVCMHVDIYIVYLLHCVHVTSHQYKYHTTLVITKSTNVTFRYSFGEVGLFKSQLFQMHVSILLKAITIHLVCPLSDNGINTKKNHLSTVHPQAKKILQSRGGHSAVRIGYKNFDFGF